ncbi:MAG: ORF6N domain-containing protein [bacterium]
MTRKPFKHDNEIPSCNTELQPIASDLTPGIENRILVIRGQRVMLDADLAYLYGVTTKRLNEQVKRNQGRFPADFMFKLTSEEWSELVANCDRFKNLKHSTVLPNVFTEHGAVMLANILKSMRAVDMSVYVVRAFIRLREIIYRNEELAKKIGDIEQRLAIHDKAVISIFQAIRKLMSPGPKKRKKVGFIW